MPLACVLCSQKAPLSEGLFRFHSLSVSIGKMKNGLGWLTLMEMFDKSTGLGFASVGNFVPTY